MNESKNRDIVLLFLQKLEMMNERERAVILRTIEIINYPVFVHDGEI